MTYFMNLTSNNITEQLISAMRVWLIILLLISMLPGQEDYVRHDAFTFKAHYFPPLDTLEMAGFWERTSIHSEAMYNGNGSWGLGYSDWSTKPYPASHPLVRVVAQHVLGLLRLIETELYDSTTVRRAILGLNWLAERQTPEGAWPLYKTDRGVITSQTVLPTALATKAMIKAARQPEFHQFASNAVRGLAWLSQRPSDDSPWNNGLYLSVLMEEYPRNHDPEILTTGLNIAIFLMGKQLPNGSWQSRTPLTTSEHALITASLMEVEMALTPLNQQRRRLVGTIAGALNYLIGHQLASGNFTPVGTELAGEKVPTYEIITFIEAYRVKQLNDFIMPITGSIRALNSDPANAGILWRGSQGGRFLAMTYALEWFLADPADSTMAPVSAITDSLSADDLLPGAGAP